MKNYKNSMTCWLVAALCVLIGLGACRKSDGDRTPFDNDTTRPDVVTNVKVINFNGGAYITYTLPATQNVLCGSELSDQQRA